MQTLEVEVSLPPGPLRLGEPCPVAVAVRNRGAVAVMVCTRLAPGYRNSISRELFADLLQADGSPAEHMVVDYDRDLPPPSAYSELAPGDAVCGSFDLFEWYAPVRPGSYRLVLHYQADEPLAARPPGTVAGVHSSAPLELPVP